MHRPTATTDQPAPARRSATDAGTGAGDDGDVPGRPGHFPERTFFHSVQTIADFR